MSHQQHVGVWRSGDRGGGAATARWQRVRLPQCPAGGAEAPGRTKLGNRFAPSRPTEIRALGEEQHRLATDKRLGQTADLSACAVAAAEKAQTSQFASEVKYRLALKNGFEHNLQLQLVFDHKQPRHQDAVSRAAMP